MNSPAMVRNNRLVARTRRSVFAFTRHLFPKHPTVRQVKVGHLQVLVFVNEYIGRRLLLSRNFENQELSILRTLVRPGDVIFDVGANIGFMTVNFADMTGPSGTVHAFEPVRKNALLGQLTAEINGFTHVHVHRIAVSYEVGKLARSNAGDDSALAYFSKAPDDDPTNVDAISIDAAVEQFKLPRIDFIKIDVEGFEYDALRGAAGILTDPTRRPRFLMIEIVDEFLKRSGSSAAQIHTMLSGHGYTSHMIVGGELKPAKFEDGLPPGNVFFMSEDQ